MLNAHIIFYFFLKTRRCLNRPNNYICFILYYILCIADFYKEYTPVNPVFKAMDLPVVSNYNCTSRNILCNVSMARKRKDTSTHVEEKDRSPRNFGKKLPSEIVSHDTRTYISYTGLLKPKNWHLLFIVTVGLCISLFVTVKCKVIPLQAWRAPECSSRLRLPDFKKIDTWMWFDYQPYAPAAFTPIKHSWYSFLLEAE